MEFKTTQLQQAYERIEIQEEDLSTMEGELLQIYRNFDILSVKQLSESAPQLQEKTVKVKSYNTQETQTLTLHEKENTTIHQNRLDNLQKQLLDVNSEITIKNKDHLKNKITEMEMNLNLMKKQLQDKQSQIVFYEKHIVELQNKKDHVNANSSTFGQSKEDIFALKVNTSNSKSI